MDKIPASVGILTLNCADVLPRALKSVERFEDVYICDGNSTDGTQDIARQFGARVVKQVETDEPNQKITDFGATRTTCVNASLRPWHLRLDADEYLSPEAAEEIGTIVAALQPKFHVYKVPRKYVWRGKVIDDTITYPNRQMRFFRRDAVNGYTKITHERLVVRTGEQIGVLRECMFIPLPDTYAELDTGRTKRALAWDRRHYEATGTPRTWAFGLAHTAATFGLFGVRFLRVRLISRGNKFPVSFEFWRFKYLFLTNIISTRVMFKKLFSRRAR